MYTMDGQTDKRMDGRTKATLIAPFHTVGGITSIEVMAQPVECIAYCTRGFAELRIRSRETTTMNTLSLPLCLFSKLAY